MAIIASGNFRKRMNRRKWQGRADMGLSSKPAALSGPFSNPERGSPAITAGGGGSVGGGGGNLSGRGIGGTPGIGSGGGSGGGLGA